MSKRERVVAVEELAQEFHDAWMDFGSARLLDDELTVSGDRDFAIDQDGSLRRGRFRWLLVLTGVHGFDIEDPDGLAGIVVRSVEWDPGRLAFVGSTPGRLVVDGFREARLDVSPHRLPKRKMTGASYISPAPPRDALVDAIEAVVRSELAKVGGHAVAAVEVVWSPRAAMWFVEAEPRRPGAAAVSIGMMGDEFVVSLPNSYWEIWRSKKGPDPLDVLAKDIEAIFAGRVEEGGFGADRPVRLMYADGRVRAVGSVHLPIPWRSRRRTNYVPYGTSVAGAE